VTDTKPRSEMTTWEIQVPRATDPTHVAEIVEATIKTSGLRVAIRRSLAGDPNSQHWHLKRGEATGTLELTWSPSQNRLWASVHANRAGSWVLPALTSLCDDLEGRLNR